MSSLRCILGLLLVPLLLVALGNCQTANDGNNYDEDVSSELEVDYVDNRIDETTTFVSPGEKFIKTVIAPLGWVSQASSDIGKQTSGVGKLIGDITKPLQNIVAPVGRAAKGGFGEVLNMIGDRFKAIYPGSPFLLLFLHYT